VPGAVQVVCVTLFPAFEFKVKRNRLTEASSGFIFRIGFTRSDLFGIMPAPDLYAVLDANQ